MRCVGALGKVQPRRRSRPARDNAVSGLRLQHHPSDDGAFVLDPDGHHLEAVCHDPQ